MQKKIILPNKRNLKFYKKYDISTFLLPLEGYSIGCDVYFDVNTINQYATIPSMEGLLTMFAGGLIEHVRNLSIGLNLYAEKLEKGGNN